MLLRAFVNDHLEQGKAARAFLAERTPESPVFVCLIVLVELTWSLKQVFGYSSDQVREVVRRLVEASDSRVEHGEIVSRCLAAPLRRGLDMSDLLIAEINKLNGCASTVTFDRGAARLVSGMEILA